MIKKHLFAFFIIISLLSRVNAQYNPQVLIYKGRLELYKKNYNEALNLFNSVIKIKPELIEPYFYRGVTKYQLKDLSGAEQDFEKTIEMNPFYVSAFHYLSVVKTEIKDYNSALNYINQAIKLSPFDSKLFLTKGIIFLQTSENDTALFYFNKALKLNPQLPEVYINKGIAYFSRKKYDIAIKNYTKAISLNSFYDDAYARRALCYLERNEIDSALWDINKAIKIDSKNALYYYWRANVYYKKPDFNNSLKDFAKVIELTPNNATAYYNKAIIESEIGLYNQAVDDYNSVIKLSPGNILPHYNKATIYFKQADYFKSIDAASDALKIYNDFAPALKLRAEAYKRTNQTTKAYIDNVKYSQIVKSGNYAKIDTNYFNKIISFNDDFFSTDTITTSQKPLGNIVIKTVDKEKDVKPFLAKYYYLYLKGFKLKNKILTFDFDNVGNKCLDKEKFKIDIDDKTINDTSLFEKALYYYCINDYNKSKVLLTKISGKLEYQKNILLSQITENSDNDRFKADTRFNSQLEYFSKIKNKDAIVFFNIANIYYVKNEHYTAIFYYNKAIKKDKDFAPAYYNKAFSLLKLMDNKNACKNFSIAGEKGINKSYFMIQKYCNK